MRLKTQVHHVDMIRVVLIFCLLSAALVAQDQLGPQSANPSPAPAASTQPATPSSAPSLPPSLEAVSTPSPQLGIETNANDETANSWLKRSTQLPRYAADILRSPATTPVLPPPVNHRLQAGDLVRMVTWGGIALNELVPVSPEGQLALPGIGAIPAAGLTRAEAQEALLGLIRGQFTKGGVVINIERGGLITVTVAGEVRQPGVIALPSGANALQALALAGGITSQGSLRRIKVSAPGQETTTLDLFPLATGNANALPSLVAGSILTVPLSGAQVQIFGSVRRPGNYELLEGQSLGDVVLLAGGLRAEADERQVRLARESSEGQQLQLLLQHALATTTASDGDRLRIDSRASLAEYRAGITLEGALRHPGTWPWHEGLTLGQALQEAGGLLPNANPDSVVLLRRLAQGTPMELNEDIALPVYEQTLVAPSADTLLQALDTIMVPERPSALDSTLWVSVDGAVRKPGRQPLTPGMTVADLIALAGGIQAEAQVDRADLIRVVESGSSRSVENQPLDLRDVLKDPGHAPLLRNRDSLVVRIRSDDRVVINFSGEIHNVGSFTLAPGTTLRTALEAAGGLTDQAFPEGARFFRQSEAKAAQAYVQVLIEQTRTARAINEQQLAQARNDNDRQVLQATILNQDAELARMERAQATGRMAGINLPGILANDPLVADIQLQHGDRLEVPARPGTVRVLGKVMTPGSLRWEPGLRVETVIGRSGGLGQQADAQRIFVVRADGSVVASAAFTGTAWDAQSRSWQRTSLKRIELLEGDAVLVPPDLRYRLSGLELAKDWSQILFQLAATVGTIAVIGN